MLNKKKMCFGKKPQRTSKSYYEDFENWKRSQISFKNMCPDMFFSSKFENCVVIAQANGFSKNLEFIIIEKRLILEESKEEIEDECSICLKKIKGKHTKPVGCNHHFHTKCINKFIETNNKNNIITRCPICRSGPEEDCEEKIRHMKDSWEHQSYREDEDD